MERQAANRTQNLETIEPVGRRIVVRKDENKRVTRAGIALPDTHEIPVITGRVIAISRELANDDDVAIKAYDKVLFDPREAIPVDLEHDNRQFVVHVDRVLAIFRRAGNESSNSESNRDGEPNDE